MFTRQIFKFIITLIILLIISGCFNAKEEKKQGNTNQIKLSGTIVKTEKEGVIIHTYIAPEDSWKVTSHIIETENTLVIIDPQLLLPFASEVIAYAKSLNKPINRLFISHGHSDHTLGSEVFMDLPIYSTLITKVQIKEKGLENIERMQGFLGTELVSSKNVVPTYTVGNDQKEEIDGMIYIYKIISNAEDGDQLIIFLPEIQTIIAQDLIYNKAHLFLGEWKFEGWIDAINGLKNKSEYNTYLAGHGPPSNDTSIFDDNIKYLESAISAFNASSKTGEIKAMLAEQYPDYGAVALLAGVNFALGVFVDE